MSLSPALASLLALALLLNSSCSSSITNNYQTQSAAAQEAIQAGDFQWAAEEFQNLHGTLGANEFLALAEEGMAWHLAGWPDLACESWIDAENTLETFQDRPTISGRTLTESAMSLVVNDNSMPYDGEGFEVSLLHAFIAWDFLRQGNLDGAMVEVFKSYAIQKQEEERYETKYGMTYFARFVSAVAQERDGRWDEAEMDYAYLAKELPNNKLIQRSLAHAQKMQTAEGRKSKPSSELILLYERGRMPNKVEESARYPIDSGWGTFVVPRFSKRKPAGPARVSISIDGNKTGRTFLLQDIYKIARANLEDRLHWVIARAVTRSILKTVAIEGAAKAVAEKRGETAGAITGIVASWLLGDTEKADCRSWTSLPLQLHVGRLSVAPGQHRVSLSDDHGRTFDLGYHTFQAGKPVLLNVRSLRKKLYSLSSNAKPVEQPEL